MTGKGLVTRVVTGDCVEQVVTALGLRRSQRAASGGLPDDGQPHRPVPGHRDDQVHQEGGGADRALRSAMEGVHVNE